MSDKPSAHGVGTNAHVHRRGAIAPVGAPRQISLFEAATCTRCGAALMNGRAGAAFEAPLTGALYCCAACAAGDDCGCAFRSYLVDDLRLTRDQAGAA